MNALIMVAVLFGGTDTVPTVGLVGHIEVFVARGTLESRVQGPRAGFSAWVDSQLAVESGGYRYRIAYVGWEPGEHDLADAFQLRDAGSNELAPMLVKIAPLLPRDETLDSLAYAEPKIQVALPPSALGLRTMVVAGLISISLSAVLFARREKRLGTKPEAVTGQDLPQLARLAFQGSLSAEGGARLERLALEHWRLQKGLAAGPVEHLLELLRDDPDAGPSLRALRTWLHEETETPLETIRAAVRPYLTAVDHEELACEL